MEKILIQNLMLAYLDELERRNPTLNKDWFIKVRGQIYQIVQACQ